MTNQFLALQSHSAHLIMSYAWVWRTGCELDDDMWTVDWLLNKLSKSSEPLNLNTVSRYYFFSLLKAKPNFSAKLITNIYTSP